MRVAKTARGPVRDVVSSASAGEVSPELQATVRAELAGQVVAVRKSRGDRALRGEVLMQLDPADLEARLRQAQAAVQSAEAQRAQAEARLISLKRQAERAQLLADRGAGTLQVSEDARAAVTEAQLAMQAAQSQKQQAQASLQAALVQRRRADIVAPFSGLLTEVGPRLGDSVAPPTALFQIIDDTRLHVDATVDEADAARVKSGQVAELHLDALPERVIAGRVARVDPVVKRDLKGARTLTVEVEVNSVDAARQAGLKPGMSANVEIVVAEKPQALFVPSNAIVGRGLSRHVYELVPEGKNYRVRKRPIQVGLANWERTEVEQGLAEGALVVTSLNEKGFEDGVLVKVAGGAPP